MKNILLISVLLAFVLTVRGADALTVENVSISETGGVTVSGEASASGTSSADADVRSFIRTEGSNTRVRVDVRTSEDGVVQATSTDTLLEGIRRLEVRVNTENTESLSAEGSAEVSASSSPSRLTRAFQQIRASLARIFSFVFFFSFAK
ncbi:hypothetical protein HYW59_03680 [Candidatus Kaiserbacteria bacterium]|nr:hypothetical protein [Candidatus Kaiserbacteria bacterium]